MVTPIPSTAGPGFPEPGSIYKRHLSADASAIDPTTIPDGSIPAAKLVNNSITALQVANAAIGGTQLANSAVGTANINNTAVTLAKLAASSVDNTKIVAPLKLVTPTPAQANLVAAPTAADFNTLLANLKTAGVLT